MKSHRTGLVAAGLIMSAALLGGAQTAGPSGQETASPKTEHASGMTFAGDTALWTVAVKPDKTSDFEQVMARLREALTKSELPLRRQQARGWKVVRLSTPLPDGNVAYVHLVHPVVPAADYTVMQILYDEFPNERRALYDLYRGAFAKNVALAVGTVVAEMTANAPSSLVPAPPTP